MLNQLFSMFSGATKQGAYELCDIETAIPDEDNLVLKNGGLCTLMELRGSYDMVGDAGFAQQCEFLYNNLKGVLNKPGHRLTFVFMRDKKSARRQIREALDPAWRKQKSMNLKTLPLLQEQEDMLSKILSYEVCYLAVYTFPSVLPSAGRKTAMKKRNSEASKQKVGVKSGATSQSPMVRVRDIVQTHNGLVSKIKDDLSAGVDLKILSPHEAIKAARMLSDPGFTSQQWRPSLLGDPLRPRLKRDADEPDPSHLQWPNVGYQIFPRDAEDVPGEGSMTKIGDRYIAPVIMDLPPQDFRPFIELFDSIDNDIPWRMSMTIETGTAAMLSKMKNRLSAANLLAWSSSVNKNIRDAVQDLIISAERDGEVLVRTNMSFATWGKDKEEAAKNRSVLAMAVQGWGSPDVIEERGDPFMAHCESIPTASLKLASTSFISRLSEFLISAPMSRPASPWEEGALPLRTQDGRLWPFQPGSSLQTTWIELISAKPGSGKSVFMSASNLALIMASAENNLPRIGMIDIGPSSKYFVDLVKAILPNHMQHLAASYRLRMTRDYAINPFDTPLGCRRPLAVDRAFLINMMTLLMTPVGSNNNEGVVELSALLVDEMYKHFEKNPKPYEPHLDEVVDNSLREYSIKLPQEPSWWEVVDAFFEKGAVREASHAQRYAVPLLPDAQEILSQSKSIKDLYSSEQRLLDTCARQISSAVNDYPILSSPSMFDIGEARIVSLDLDEVAKTGGPAATRQTAVMYMLSRFVLCREYYRSLDSVNEIPSAYQSFHRERIMDDRRVFKRICMDEFHRTEGIDPVRNQVEVDMREGRKFNVMVTLASQRDEDFTKGMVELATSTFILHKGTENTIKRFTDLFALNEDAVDALRNYVVGASSRGAPMLLIGSTNQGDFSQLVYLNLGPRFLWAVSTTVEDVELRNLAFEEVGDMMKALDALARTFPGGCKKEIEKRKRHGGNGRSSDTVTGRKMYLDVYRDMVAKNIQEDLYEA